MGYTCLPLCVASNNGAGDSYPMATYRCSQCPALPLRSRMLPLHVLDLGSGPCSRPYALSSEAGPCDFESLCGITCEGSAGATYLSAVSSGAAMAGSIPQLLMMRTIDGSRTCSTLSVSLDSRIPRRTLRARCLSWNAPTWARPRCPKASLAWGSLRICVALLAWALSCLLGTTWSWGLCWLPAALPI